MTRAIAPAKSAAFADLPEGASREAIMVDFAKRLQKKIIGKGWNQSDLARAASKFMQDGAFGRDSVSNYIRGKALPTSTHLNAICKALACKPEDLLPVRPSQTVEQRLAAVDVRDAGDGNAWLRINTAAPWPVALKVIELLKSGK